LLLIQARLDNQEEKDDNIIYNWFYLI